MLLELEDAQAISRILAHKYYIKKLRQALQYFHRYVYLNLASESSLFFPQFTNWVLLFLQNERGGLIES